jgi:FlaA1/EpsC-like NDP-sugar epimerase
MMHQTGRASVVRFGNVIGSTGSVVPLFMEQIAAGGPVTVTDSAMTRYFMTVGEAAELILQAGAAGPATYVLDMGEPVSIDRLARDMIRLSGRRDVRVVYSGIRAGEKIHEELSSEPLQPSGIEGIWRVVE